MNETEGTSQDDVTQPNNQPSELVIFVQSVGGKKKGRVAMIGSLGKVLDDNFQRLHILLALCLMILSSVA